MSFKQINGSTDLRAKNNWLFNPSCESGGVLPGNAAGEESLGYRTSEQIERQCVVLN